MNKIIIGPLGWNQALFYNYQLADDVVFFKYSGAPESDIIELIELISKEEVIVYAFSFGGLILQAALNQNKQLVNNIHQVFYYDALVLPTTEALAGLSYRRESYENEQQIFNDYLSPEEMSIGKRSLVLSQFDKVGDLYIHKYSNSFMHTYLEYIINQNIIFDFNYMYKIYAVNYIENVPIVRQQLIEPAEHLMMIENEQQVKLDLQYNSPSVR